MNRWEWGKLRRKRKIPRHYSREDVAYVARGY